MFFDDDIRGDRLPPGTVCLTYDDGPGESEGSGPGPHTRELGRYLRDEGVQATFFVVGRHVELHRESVIALDGWGHLVGNHTFSHPPLVALAESGGDVVGEVGRTDELLRSIVGGPVCYFRAPYGNWRQSVELSPGYRRDLPWSILASLLNATGRFSHVVGPIGWDVDGGDWACWRMGISPEEAARRHIAMVDRAGGGVILMHDSSEDGNLRARNKTLLMTRLMIPELKRRGYRFVRLDEVPQVRTAALVRSQVVLTSNNGRPLAFDPRGGDEIAPDLSVNAPRLPFGVAPLEAGRCALRARNGLFLSEPHDGVGLVTATSPTSGARESFRFEAAGVSEFAIRSASGGYLAMTDTVRGTRLAVAHRRHAQLALAVERVYGT